MCISLVPHSQDRTTTKPAGTKRVTKGQIMHRASGDKGPSRDINYTSSTKVYKIDPINILQNIYASAIPTQDYHDNTDTV